MMTITKATPKDIPDILTMMRALCAFHGDRCEMGLADAQQRLIDQGHLTTLIARCGSDPVGYAVLEPRWRPMHHGDAIDIAHLFVVERLRGRGIGRQLIDAARACARDKNSPQLTIGTSPDNPAAAAAYRAMGLDEITRTPGARFAIPL